MAALNPNRPVGAWQAKDGQHGHAPHHTGQQAGHACARTFIAAGVSRYALIRLPRSHVLEFVPQLGSSLMTRTAVVWARRHRGSDGGHRRRRRRRGCAGAFCLRGGLSFAGAGFDRARRQENLCQHFCNLAASSMSRTAEGVTTAFSQVKLGRKSISIHSSGSHEMVIRSTQRP